MIIKRNSWHYKLVTFFISDPPKSLCTYFWTVVALLILSFILVNLAVMPFVMLFVDEKPGGWIDIFGGLGWVMYSVVLVVLMFVLIAHVNSRLRERSRKKRGNDKQERKPNILIEYVKAKKRKICPILEFTD